MRRSLRAIAFQPYSCAYVLARSLPNYSLSGSPASLSGSSLRSVTQDVHSALRPPGSHDPEKNPRLAAALHKAKDAGVPKTTIEAAFVRVSARAS